MEFKITEAEAREMAKFEEEVGCDPSAGADWGIHLDKVIELTLNRVDLNHNREAILLRSNEKVEVNLLTEQC